jgi:membrane-associated protease RseP (regulator of RpoE activity)
MGSVIILIIIVVASLLCVRAGAIALELTGMERDKARFQALSAFTNTGFTTRETEEITNFPVRRKLVTVLIVLGHAGTVSVIATFATSMIQREPLYMAMNLGVIILSLYVVYRLALWRGLTVRMREFFRGQLLKRYGLCCPSLEEMLKVNEGFGVVRLVIKEGSPLIGHPLSKLELKKKKVQILSIIRGEEAIVVPGGEDLLLAGDVVICYGDMAEATSLFHVEPGKSALPERESIS